MNDADTLLRFVDALDTARVSRGDPPRLLTTGELVAETGLAPAAFWAAAIALRRVGLLRTVTVHSGGRLGLSSFESARPSSGRSAGPAAAV
jgi:hypothetical protein